MKTTETFIAGLKNIFAHKLRSFLTLAGIVIGVAAVTTMFSSVSAMKKLIEDTITSLGYDNVIILYSSFPKDENNKLKKYHQSLRFKNLIYKDYEVLQKKLNNVEFIYASIEEQKNCVINKKKSKIRLKGISNFFFNNKHYLIGKGKFFSIIQEEKGDNVCIIGASLDKKYFPKSNAIGKYISFDNIRLKIIGVLKEEDFEKGIAKANPWERKRDHETCFITSKFAAKYFRPNMQVDNIWIKATNADKVGTVYNQARQLILAHHNMADDIEIMNISERMLEIREQINTQLKNWNIILLCISGISLFTGGIGLFSILLISIRERMKEIGVRKSIGAKNRDIFAHFLFESVILAMIGGMLGAGLSLLLTKLVTSKIGIEISFPLLGIIVGLIFAIFVGFVSGFYPAYKASKINPVKAIFYVE